MSKVLDALHIQTRNVENFNTSTINNALAALYPDSTTQLELDPLCPVITHPSTTVPINRTKLKTPSQKANIPTFLALLLHGLVLLSLNYAAPAQFAKSSYRLWTRKRERTRRRRRSSRQGQIRKQRRKNRLTRRRGGRRRIRQNTKMKAEEEANKSQTKPNQTKPNQTKPNHIDSKVCP